MKALFYKFQIILLAAIMMLLPAFALAAQTTQQRCDSFKAQFGGLPGGSNVSSGQHVFCSATEAAVWIIKILLGFSGVVTVIFLIIGGYLYLTSGGNDEQAEKGKKVLVNAIIGLVVIIMSTAIVTVVSGVLAQK